VGIAGLSLVVPAASRAATIAYAGGSSGAVVYTAGPGETLDTRVGYEPGCLTDGSGTFDCVTFSGDTIGAAPTQCAPISGRESCVLDPDHSGVRVVGGAGNDGVSVFDAGIGGFPAATAERIVVDGGAGNDTLIGGDAGETLDGGPGADRLTGRGGNDVLDGGDGNDTLGGDSDSQYDETTNGGDDVLRGGPGDDRLTGDAPAQNAVVGRDVLDGGPGTDTVYDDWYRFDGQAGDEDPPPAVSLDGQANDGRPGEGDDVTAVERIDTGYQPLHATPGTYVGSDGPDTFNVIFTNGSVSALGGNDVVTGGDGPDAIDGGAGDDQLSGGFGNDAITGGPGRDDIGGDRTAACAYGPLFGSCTIGSGNDPIYAQDGEQDTIDCGPGGDTAYVDAIDVVTGCESVHATGGVSGPGPSPAPAALPAAKLALGHARLASIARARAIAVTCRLARAGRCTVRATISASAARKLRLKPRRRAKTFSLGSGGRTFKQAGSGRVRVKLSRKVARALRRARSLRVTLTATAAYAAGSRTTTTKATFRR
jgi:Ca2+-binding RTX toxin-like protein